MAGNRWKEQHMATSGILSQLGNSTNSAQTSASTLSGSSSSSSSSSSSNISSSDFLTLLVTEMQNQDPTASTDPNEYINQLVNVNSLEQLISINQTLTNAYDSSTSSSSSQSHTAAASTAALSTADSTNNSAMSSTNSATVSSLQKVAGNLGVPATNPSAQAIASALTRSNSKASGVSGATAKSE